LGDPLDAEELLATLDVYALAKLDADHARSTGLVDEMTGVYNSRGLARRAEELGAHASRLHRGLGCVLIAPESEPTDGTDGGTPTTEPPLALQRRIAAALRATTRQSDAIGRLNPSAFAVVAVDTDAGQARRLAERLVTAILDERHPTVTPMPRFRLKVGYHGVTDFHVAAIDSAELMLRASAALHNARTDQPDAWIQQYID
jgi:GGDEF domain-containing protein